MAGIRIRDFRGEIPKRQRTLLPPGFAERAIGTRLEDGALAPFREATVAGSVATNAKTMFRMDDEWLSWPTRVHAQRGPVAQDRLYYAGDGTPKLRIDGEVYDLALHGPVAAPTLEAVNPQIIPELNDPDAEIDLTDFIPPEVEDIDPIPGASRFLSLTQAPVLSQSIIDPNTFDIVTAPVLEIVDSLDAVDTSNSTTKITMSIVSGNAKFKSLFAALPPSNPVSTALLGVVNFTPTTARALPPILKTGTGDVVFRFTPDDSDIEAIEYTEGAELKPTGGPVAGQPWRIAVIRQPEGGISGRELVTQPAIGFFDINGDLCDDLEGFEVSVRVSRETGGSIVGLRSQKSVGGIVRFRDIKASQAEGEPIILEFTATDLGTVASDEIFVAPDRLKLAKDIVFTYTYVTEFDEESAPAPVSEAFSWYPGLQVKLTDMSDPASGRAINRMRFYRSETSTFGVTDLYFFKEVPIEDIDVDGVVYEEDEHVLAEILPSNDYDPIPDDAEGLIALPNGMMAAFHGREIVFCEPYIPHAWPIKYRLTVDSPIMGLVSFGSSMVVLTTNTPYIAQGFSPETMRMEKIDQSMPCVSKESIVDLGYAAAFATNEGLAVIGQGMGANLITKDLFTADQWQDMQPKTIVAERYRDKYMFSFRHVDGAEHDATCFVSLTGDVPHVSYVEHLSDVFHLQPETGKVFYLSDTGGVMEFDSRRSRPVPYLWRSGCYMIPGLVNFGAIMVRTDVRNARHAEEIEIDVFANDRKIITIAAADTPVRLPGGFLSDKWQFEVRGTMNVVELAVAGSIEELISV